MTESPRKSDPTPSDRSSDPARRSPGPTEIPRPADLEARWLLPSEDVGKPCSIFVYGDCRPVVNGVAFAMADMLDLAPLWLEVRDGGGGHDGPTVASAGWVPPERVFLSEAGSGLEPNDGVANLALGSIVRSDEPAEALTELTDFLRLPELLQEAIGRAMPAPSPRAIVLANVERVEQLFPREPGSLHRFLHSILTRSVSLVAAHTGPPREQRFAFSAVFRVHASSFASWGLGSIECEKGLKRGPFSVGRLCGLSDIPSIARVLAGLEGSKP